MNNRAFTLIELLIVVSIIGILSTVAVTAYIGVQLKAARSEAYTNLESLKLIQEQSFADNGTYAGPAAGTAAIRALLPRFRPGGGAQFTFAITSAVNNIQLSTPVAIPYAGATAAIGNPLAPCFIATATGIVNTRVAGDVFAIDCNNNRNF